MKVRKFVSILLMLLLLLGLTACGSSAKAPAENMAYDKAEMEAAPAEKPGAGLTTDSQDSSASLPTDRKLIRNIYIEAETEDLTALTDALTTRIAALGGYVETREVYNGSTYASRRYRHADLTIRIPAENVDGFVEHVKGASNVVSSNESIDDVTLTYVDTESHVKALETEQERLLALLAKTDNLKDILTLEERLTKVRFELERYASRLRALDNQVTYATIQLSVLEVKEYTPVVEEEPTVWQRVSQGFTRSLKDIGEGFTDFFVWFTVNSPYLLIWGAVLAVVLMILRKRGILKAPARKRKAPKEPTE